MSTRRSIEIRYRFERLGGSVSSEFERAAGAACHLVETMPWAVSRLPFGSASRISGGLLEALPAAAGVSQGSIDPQGPIRLRAIETSKGILLENSYDAHGRLRETTYPDGVTMRYRWNDAGLLATVSLVGGYVVDYEYREDGLLSAATYPGRARFRYLYNDAGQLLSRVYADGKSVTYGYDRHGRPVEVAFGDAGFVYDWDGKGSLQRVTFQRQGEVHELRLNKGRLEITLMPDRGDCAAPSESASALGLWVFSAEDTPSEMALPDGERLCARSCAAGGMAFWDSSGQTTYRHDKEGAPSEVLYANGLRAVWHRSSDRGKAYLVSPGGVLLYEYGPNGRLLKIRSVEGPYAVFTYSRAGAVKKVATGSGPVQLRHDNAGRLLSVQISSGVSAALSYGTTARPTSISFSISGTNVLSAALACMRTVWQWTAMRSSLRLEDSVLREM
jgi:YD repeat-containing protein